MSSATIHTELDTAPDEFAEFVVSPSSDLSTADQTGSWIDFESSAVKSRGFLGGCRFFISFLAGYLASTLIHLIVLSSLAVWIIRAEPRHSEPLSLAAQTAGQEAPPELLASSAPAAAAMGGTSTAPMIFTTDLPLEMTGPRLATGLQNAKGASAGIEVEATALAGGEGPVGKQVNFFGTAASGNSFVFVLDTSGSMNDGNRYHRAAEELLQALDSLNSDQQFCVIAFNNKAWPMLNNTLEQTVLLPASDENKARLKAWLEGLQPIGWTDPRDAVALALKLSPSAIFFLSDGEFKQGPPERKLGYVTLSKVNRANRAHVPIHTLAFEDQANAPILRGMAKASGGSYRFVPAEK